MVPLAGAISKQGRPIEAEALYKRAITVAETAYGSNHPQLAAALEHYANFLRRQHRVNEAELMSSKAQTIRARSTPGRSAS